MSDIPSFPYRLLWEEPQVVSGANLTRVCLPGLAPLPWSQMLAVFVYATVSCLAINDAVKVAMIKWRVPTAIA